MFVQATQGGAVALLVTLMGSLAMLLMGTLSNTFSFQFEGLTGKLLGDRAHVDYSFVSVGLAVPTASGTPNDFSVRWMEACYFAFGLCMPAAFLCVLGVVWLVPMSLSGAK